jgi:hypothetical protein
MLTVHHMALASKTTLADFLGSFCR